MRIGGYNRTEDTSKYELFHVKETIVHPWFKTKYTGAVTYVSCLYLRCVACMHMVSGVVIAAVTAVLQASTAPSS